jgi:hypothetical protein
VRFGSIVARRLDELTGPEIQLIEPSSEYTILEIVSSEEWVVWHRQPSSLNGDFVLENIETGEERIIASRTEGALRSPGMWGDRVVWGSSDGNLKEYRISTGVTRNVISEPALDPMYTTSVWEHYALFNHQPDDGREWDAYLVDLDTGETRRVTPSGSNQEQASIGGGTIVWTDFRGSSDGGPGGMHVYVYSLTTGREYVLNPSAIGGSEPMVYGRNVVWNAVWNDIIGVWATRIGDI